jgi:hypothetical protein
VDSGVPHLQDGEFGGHRSHVVQGGLTNDEDLGAGLVFAPPVVGAEPDPVKHRIRPGLLGLIPLVAVAGLPLATVVNYAYTTGQAMAYGIPPDLVSFELTRLIVPVLLTVMGCAAVLWAFTLVVDFVSLPLRACRAIMLGVLLLVPFLPPYAWSHLRVWLMLIPMYVVVFFYGGPWLVGRLADVVARKTARIRRSVKANRLAVVVGRLMWRDFVEPVISAARRPVSRKRSRISGLTNYSFLLLLGLVLLFVGARQFGEWSAHRRINFGIVATSSNDTTVTAILAVYGGKVYQAPVDRATKKIVGDIKLVNLADLNDIEVRLENIGPLVVDR